MTKSKSRSCHHKHLNGLGPTRVQVENENEANFFASRLLKLAPGQLAQQLSRERVNKAD